MTFPTRASRNLRRLKACFDLQQQHPQALTVATAQTSIHHRRFSSSTTGSGDSGGGGGSTVAFDRGYKKLQRNNAARAHHVWDPNDSDRVGYDYFREEIARRLVDRLDDIKRDEGFPLALDIGTICFLCMGMQASL